ncbi:MAG: flagellar hook capping protein [Eubacterium sp.]|nr:flagellar hook capping protein [Eubacterium sp.]
MSNVAVQITDGTVVDTTSSSSSSAVSTSQSTIDSDTFLTLLVAEMQYQDPLEPTSNTEWVSQYATFTQVEQMNELTSQMSQSYASSLVGQEVIVIDDTASSGYTSGTVDYVYMEDGVPYLAVGDNLFTLDKVDSVVNADYLDAITTSSTFAAMIDALPTTDSLTYADKSLVEAAREAYDSMTDYQKKYVDSEDLSTLESLETTLATVVSNRFTYLVENISETVTTADADAITAAREYYDSMQDYQKEAVSEDSLALLEAAEEAYAALTAEEEE